MHRFEIWAPLAKRPSVSLGGEARAMDGPDDRGWWRLNTNDTGASDAVHGTDYGF